MKIIEFKLFFLYGKIEEAAWKSFSDFIKGEVLNG